MIPGLLCQSLSITDLLSISVINMFKLGLLKAPGSYINHSNISYNVEQYSPNLWISETQLSQGCTMLHLVSRVVVTHNWYMVVHCSWMLLIHRAVEHAWYRTGVCVYLCNKQVAVSTLSISQNPLPHSAALYARQNRCYLVQQCISPVWQIYDISNSW